MTPTHPLIQVINPNASKSMTARLSEGEKTLKLDGITIEFLTSERGPASVEGYSDGVRAANGLIELIEANRVAGAPEPDALVVACFDDTGVDALRELTRCPVIGIGEAAAHFASLLGQRFMVMTSLARSISIIENNLRQNGLIARCSGVYASDIPVLALEERADAYDQLRYATEQALNRSQAEVLVLGCAGMSQWVSRLEQDLQVPVIDGVRVAIRIAADMIALNLVTSKRMSYRFPEVK